jgi:hypothetical protein
VCNLSILAKRVDFYNFRIYLFAASDKHRFFYCIEADRLNVHSGDINKVFTVADAVKRANAVKRGDFVEGLEEIVEVKRTNDLGSLVDYRLKKEKKKIKNDTILADARERKKAKRFD